MAAETAVSGVFHCLGVAAGWPCQERRHSSYLYRLSGVQVMLDCGGGASGAYQGLGFGPDALDRILLSHMHSDHVGSFSMLIQGMWVQQRRKPLVVHAPALAIDALQAWLQATLIFDGLIGFPIAWEPLMDGQTVHIEGLRVTPHLTTHLASLERSFGGTHPATSFEAFSFLIEGDGFRIGHSADIGAVTDLEPLLQQPLNLLVCELAHVEADALLERLGRASIGEVVFIHLEDGWWSKRDELQRLASQRLIGTKVGIAMDGDRISVLGTA